jgi:predicted lipoprotein with Yx(FWY)xxD motif
MSNRTKPSLAVAGLGLAVLALTAGCGGSSATSAPLPGTGSTVPAAASQPTPASAATEPSAEATLGSNSPTVKPLIGPAMTAVGTVLVNSKSMTVYDFGKDRKSHSACTGTCAKRWPFVKAPAKLPKALPGVSGKLGVLVRPNGKRQLTVDGRPVYTFSGDHAPGDANGQGLRQGLWTVVSAAGKPLQRPAK